MTESSYIHAGWLIDGTGGPIRKQVLLTVRDGLIGAIDRFVAGDAPDSRLVTDLSFATLAPAFIDSHVHLTMSGTVDLRSREHQLRAGCDELDRVIARHLDHHLGHGVLAVRDGGDRNDCVGRYLQAREKEGRFPVRVSTSGRAWHCRGRYGALIGRSPAAGKSLAQALAEDGGAVNQVKLVNSGLNSLKTFGRQTPSQFSRDEIRGFVEAAARLGLDVMVHANGEEPVRDALEAGCHSIEHGFFMGRENLQRLADRQAFWVPTACTMKAYAELLTEQGDHKGAAVARKNLEHQLKQLALARELGVPVALGTDAGSPGVLHGESVVEEMKLLMKAGYSLAEAVRCATQMGARLLGLKNMGSIGIGGPADFLVARGGPSQLPRKFSYLEAIYIGGESSEFYRKHPGNHVG